MSRTPDPRHRHALIAIIATGLLVRLIVFTVLQPFPPLAKDDSVYDMLGWNLLSGNGFSASAEAPFDPMAVRTPGYPAFLAGVYAVAGRSWNAVRLVQIALSAVALFLTYVIARRVANPRTGLLASAAYAILPASVIFPSLLLTEANQALLVVVIVYCFYRAMDDPHLTRWYVGLALALAAATMQRPDYQLLIVPLFGALVVLAPGRGGALRRAGVGAICFAAVLLPWFARNCTVFDQCIGLSTGTGHTAMTAKFEAEGKSGRELLEAFRTRYGEEFRRTYGREMTYLDGARPDQDVIRKRDFVEFVRTEPAVYAEHSARRMVLLWLPRSWADVYGFKADFSEALGRREYTLLAAKAVLLLFDGAAIALSAVGILFACRRWRSFAPMLILFAYTTAMYGLVYSSGRYRVPLLPLVMVLAAFGVERLRLLAASRRQSQGEVQCVAS